MLFVSVLARLPFGAIGLLVLLKVSAGHSYAAAGLVDAAYALMVALCQPIVSRIVDQRGQTAVLIPTAIAGGLATAAIGLLPASSGLGYFILVAALNGALQPPLGGAMRAVWDLLLNTDEERHIGYSIDAAATEVIWTGGPLVVVGVIAASFGVTAGLLVCGALTGLGGLAFAMSGPSRRWRGSGNHLEGKKQATAIRAPGVQTLVVVSLGAGASFGAIEFGVTAFAKHHGTTSLVGLLMAVWAIGSFTAGVLMTKVGAPKDPAGRLVSALLFLTAGDFLLGLAGGPWTLGLLLIVCGTGIAPMFSTANSAMGNAAAEGTLTEAYSWTTTGIMVGATAGAPIAGLLVDHVSAAAALSFAGVPTLVAAVVVWLRRETIAPPAEQPATTAG
jgi:MFS family permease